MIVPAIAARHQDIMQAEVSVHIAVGPLPAVTQLSDDDDGQQNTAHTEKKEGPPKTSKDSKETPEPKASKDGKAKESKDGKGLTAKESKAGKGEPKGSKGSKAAPKTVPKNTATGTKGSEAEADELEEQNKEIHPEKRPASSSTMKRPAASAPAMERPAKATRVSVSAYRYARNGVWGFKVAGKEILRVSCLTFNIPSTLLAHMSWTACWLNLDKLARTLRIMPLS